MVCHKIYVTSIDVRTTAVFGLSYKYFVNTKYTIWLYITVLQETYGEDPYLVGELSQPYVKGFQGNHPRYVRVTSTCKHMDAYAGPDSYPISRYEFDAKVGQDFKIA